MLATIEGVIQDLHPLGVILEVQGLGYEVNVPLLTTERIPGIGARIRFFVYPVYREDSQTLYGFLTKDDKEFFRLLVEKVTGIGPKMALAILSKFNASAIRSAILRGDSRFLAECPGIGKKTAERMIIELKDKVGSFTVNTGDGFSLQSETPVGLGADRYGDAVAALITLGFKTADADKAVKKAVGSLNADATVEMIIKKALA